MINLPKEGVQCALFPYLGLPTAHTNKQTWRAGSQANPYNNQSAPPLEGIRKNATT